MIKFLIVIMLFTVTACVPTTVKNTGERLLLTQETIVSLAVAIDRQCTLGTLTQTQCNEAAMIYQQAKTAYSHALAAEQAAVSAAIAGVVHNRDAGAIAVWTAVATELVMFAARVGIIKE